MPAVGRHPAARKKASPGETLWIYRGFIRDHADPPGWKPRLHVSQDADATFFRQALKAIRAQLDSSFDAAVEIM